MLKLTEGWLIDHGFESDDVEREGKVVHWHHLASGLTCYTDARESREQFSVGKASLNLWLETEKFGLSSEQSVLDVIHVLTLVEVMY